MIIIISLPIIKRAIHHSGNPENRVGRCCNDIANKGESTMLWWNCAASFVAASFGLWSQWSEYAGRYR